MPFLATNVEVSIKFWNYIVLKDFLEFGWNKKICFSPLLKLSSSKLKSCTKGQGKKLWAWSPTFSIESWKLNTKIFVSAFLGAFKLWARKLMEGLSKKIMFSLQCLDVENWRSNTKKLHSTNVGASKLRAWTCRRVECEVTFRPSTPGSTRWLCMEAQMLLMKVEYKCNFGN